jgi:hypothetical protein
MIKLSDILKQILFEGEDRCKRIADRKYDKPSAYKSGAIVRCRKGNIWKDIKEEELTEGSQFGVLYHYTEDFRLKKIIESNILKGPISLTRSQDSFVKDWMGNVPIIVLDQDKLRHNYKIRPYQSYDEYGDSEDEMEEVVDKSITNLNKYIIKIILPKSNPELESLLKEKDIPYEIKLNEDESLHKWFQRSGPKGKEKGWVDCNAPDGKGGYKACGRKEGENRSKYPACRPTPAGCKREGKGKTWGKIK